ncbi:MAG: PilZ domain-containing protein [Phycisphaerae bacterium]|nr:PilZ domain-containing protein [Phycisphaerae bacterium]
MATLNTLTGNEVASAIESASKDKVGVTVTVYHQDRWFMFSGDMLDAGGESLWITYPQSDHGPADYEFSPGQSVGVTFRRGFQRFLFSTDITSVDKSGTAGVQLGMPEEMQISERRVGQRVEMPALATVEASIWLGGRQVKHDEADAVVPAWSGRVLDLSEGGCYVRTDSEVSQYIEIGDTVGLQLTIGRGDAPEQILIDAQFCRSDPDGDGLTVGLQFVDIDESEQNREAHEKIRAKLCEF